MRQQLTRWKVQKLPYGFSCVLFYLLRIIPSEIPHTYRETKRGTETEIHRQTDRHRHMLPYILSSAIFMNITNIIFIHSFVNSFFSPDSGIRNPVNNGTKVSIIDWSLTIFEHIPKKINWP